jgi:Holliday junction resolvase RusA-like endonuclease
MWSYAGNLNFSIMGCKKAVPDIDRLADGLLDAMTELQMLSSAAQNTEHDLPPSTELKQ